MYGTLKVQLADDLAALQTEGLFKAEAVIRTPQSARIAVGDQTLINFCGNNYLGLADHPAMIAAAQQALDRWGLAWPPYASSAAPPRFTRSWKAASRTFSGLRTRSCTLLLRRERWPVRDAARPEDAVISDELNHASIIDGVRLVRPPECATPTGTWPTSRRNYASRKVHGID